MRIPIIRATYLTYLLAWNPSSRIYLLLSWTNSTWPIPPWGMRDFLLYLLLMRLTQGMNRFHPKFPYLYTSTIRYIIGNPNHNFHSYQKATTRHKKLLHRNPFPHNGPNPLRQTPVPKSSPYYENIWDNHLGNKIPYYCTSMQKPLLKSKIPHLLRISHISSQRLILSLTALLLHEPIQV